MTTTATQQTDTIPAREAAFAEWLRTALLAAIPADGTPMHRDNVLGFLFGRNSVPAAITTGDAFCCMARMADAGEIEWCGEARESVRRRAPVAAPIALDAARLARLRTLATAGVDRLSAATDKARARLIEEADAGQGIMPERIATTAQRLALADAEERGYRAAVADLLGALEVAL